MIYLEKDFEGCVFNPLRQIGKNVEDIYPELRDREGFLVGSFGVGVDREKVMRWVLGLYQPESPLIGDYPDYKVRRYQCGVMVGFEMLGGVLTQGYLDIVLGKNGKVNRFAVDFCRIMRDDDYTELRAYQDKLYHMLGLFAGSSDAKDDKVIMFNIKELKERIEVLKKKYLVQDSDGKLIEELTAVMDNDYVDMSREALVRRMEKGEDLYGERFVPPYGKDYVKKFHKDVNKLRFEGKFMGN